MKELEGRRDSADAYVEKTTKSLKALQQELDLEAFFRQRGGGFVY